MLWQRRRSNLGFEVRARARSIGLDFFVQRTEVFGKSVTLVAFTVANKPNLNDSIRSHISDATDVLNSKGFHHVIDLRLGVGLLADIAMPVRRVSKKFGSHGSGHAA